MARKPGGTDHLESAKELLKKAKTADELRAAQAIVLPLALGLSLEQTALVIGRSVGVTCTMRTRFAHALGGGKKVARSKQASAAQPSQSQPGKRIADTGRSVESGGNGRRGYRPSLEAVGRG